MVRFSAKSRVGIHETGIIRHKLCESLYLDVLILLLLLNAASIYFLQFFKIFLHFFDALCTEGMFSEIIQGTNLSN